MEDLVVFRICVLFDGRSICVSGGIVPKNVLGVEVTAYEEIPGVVVACYFVQISLRDFVCRRGVCGPT